MTKIFSQRHISAHNADPVWNNTFSKRERAYLTHVINGLIEFGGYEDMSIQYGEKEGRRVLHIFEPFATLNSIGYSSPSVVSISFNDKQKIEFLTGGDNGLGIFSTDVTLERTTDFPRNSTFEIDFWHFVDAIGDASQY